MGSSMRRGSTLFWTVATVLFAMQQGVSSRSLSQPAYKMPEQRSGSDGDALSQHSATTVSHPYEMHSYAFMHIPKTGGTSFIRDLPVFLNMDIQEIKQNMKGFCDGCEHCLSDFKGKHVLTLFRRPRAHVYSQFLHCKYSRWGQDEVTKTTFRNDTLGDDSAPSRDTPTKGFRQWLLHFLNDWEPSRDLVRSHRAARSVRLRSLSHTQREIWLRSTRDPNQRWLRGTPSVWGDQYNCYNPMNMQSRSLVCSADDVKKYPSSHFAVTREDPPVAQGLKEVEDVFWAGINEHYVPSLCLLQYKLGKPLADGCDCGKRDEFVRHKLHHIDHGLPKHSVSRDVTMADLALIDELTKADHVIYKAALARFQRDIWEMQNTTGIEIMCE